MAEVSKVERKEARTERKAERENVTLFGSNDQSWRHVHGSGSYLWGVILIVSGIIFFFNTLGILPWDIWNNLWQFWPIVLILWGLQVILGQGKLARVVISLITLIILVAIAFFVVAQYNSGVSHQLPGEAQHILNMMGGQRQ